MLDRGLRAYIQFQIDEGCYEQDRFKWEYLLEILEGKATYPPADLKICIGCGLPFRYPPSDNKEQASTCAWCALTVTLDSIDVNTELLRKQRFSLDMVVRAAPHEYTNDVVEHLKGIQCLLDNIYDQLVPVECPACGEKGYDDPSECSFCEGSKQQGG